MVIDSEDVTGYYADILAGLNVAGSTLSFLGCTFILITYYYTPSLQKLAFQLLLYVSIADMMSSFVNLWGSLPNDSIACKLQGFFSCWGRLASFFWVGFISLVMYELVFDRAIGMNIVENMKKYAHWIIWPLSLFLAVLPFTTNDYENTGGWCFIGHSESAQIWAFVSFYSWLWLVMCGTVLLYCKLYSKISEISLRESSASRTPSNDRSPDPVRPSRAGSGGGSDDEDKMGSPRTTARSNTEQTRVDTDQEATVVSAAQLRQSPREDQTKQAIKKQRRMLTMVRRMFFYPAVLFICYFFATFRRIWNFSGQDSPFGIVCMRVFTAALYGFGNSLIYARTVWPKIRKEMTLCKRSEKAKK